MKKLKAEDKVVQQMSRDGLVEVNKATGETGLYQNQALRLSCFCCEKEETCVMQETHRGKDY